MYELNMQKNTLSMHCIYVQLSYMIIYHIYIYTHVVRMDEGGFLCTYIYTLSHYVPYIP